ncbi:hypothetical protein ACVK1V_002870 [Bacillus subtilis]|nr:hypothetical protein BSNT_10786 [Bacillus subtilis subsp. natto BEST195]
MIVQKKTEVNGQRTGILEEETPIFASISSTC